MIFDYTMIFDYMMHSNKAKFYNDDSDDVFELELWNV